ncbi:MAG: 3'-5' exonuclease domain-containing protein 2 [Desulfovibrionaceae bacterium]|nr:3'-5' exonuclease domain-containing protein 2 [Desulfovibrionaceae bacterium]
MTSCRRDIIAHTESETASKFIVPEGDGAPIDALRRKLSTEEINGLPAGQYEGEIILIKTQNCLPAAMENLVQEKVLGFDTESRPIFSKGKQSNPPAILQLAGADKVYIFQLNCMGFASELAALLENQAIIKSGVAVRDDIRELQRLHSFKPAGFVDLSQVARHNRLETHGLRNMAANFFGIRITKGARCSNWEQKELTRKQLLYAATDAWISRELYFEMKAKGLEFPA